MQTLARFVVRYRWLVIGAWVVLIVAVNGLATAAGGAQYRETFTLPHTETQTVMDLLKANGQADQTGPTGTVVVQSRGGTLDTGQAPDGLLPALQDLCRAGLHIASSTSPWGSVDCASATVTPAPRTGPSPLLSADGTTALVTVSWQGGTREPEYLTGTYERLDSLNSDRFRYEFTGEAFTAVDASTGGPSPEALGFLAALIILALVFRTVGATVLPLASAVAALSSGLAILSLLTHAFDVASFAEQLAMLMVIGVGVDYALFIVTRFRRNLMRGMSVNDAVAVAVDTSGRAVLFAGATVCVAILGLIALRVSFLYGVAVGVAVAVAMTLVASLTLLPAALSLLGYRVLPRKIRQAVRDGSYVDEPHRTRWASWSEVVARHKYVAGGLAGLVIVLLAVPFLSLDLGHADQSNDPKGTTTRAGYELISDKFGEGYNSALELVIDSREPIDEAYLERVAEALAEEPGVEPTSITPTPLGKNLALVSFKATTSPQDPNTDQLVKRLRSHLAPELEKGTAGQVYVFGGTAVYIDFADVLAAKMPQFFAAVIGLSFLLLMIAFRSLVVPLTAAVMNLFAAAASFGVVVAIFQWGWLSEAMGIGKGGPIEAFIPVIFFAVLFGLSMDYQVFLVSRMHEEWVHTGDNRRAISVGQAETGGIITAAALIMIAVFGGFVLGDDRIIKLFGIGLGSAIFIDAFILRTVLVPAVMHVGGKANWFFPAWLDKVVPHVSVEPPDEPSAPKRDEELAAV